MLEIFRILLKYKLSPDCYYLLISIQEGVSAPGINESQVLRYLKGQELIDEDIKLTPTALEIINTVESSVKVVKKKVTKDVLGSDADSYIDQYRELWDMGKLPSGVPARVNKKELESKFVKFFQKFNYTWPQIIEATKYYIDEYEMKSPKYLYMQNSSYFISKMLQDKSTQHTLANYIELLSSGDLVHDNPFKDNVV